jgi:ammonium transporter, Amt family
MTTVDLTIAASTVWVVVAAVLVMFMQAGFAFLEAGLTRMKNVGHVAAKNVLIFAICSLVYYLVGYGMAFGDGGNGFVGGSGFAPSVDDLLAIGEAPFSWFSTIPAGAGYLFQVVFAGVSLAIVWGAMAERAKLWVYFAFGVVFTLIYSVTSHWIWHSGGWLFGKGMQDFAGSTVVHLIGATGGFAALLLLGPRRGKYGPDGKPRAIPGHSMPLVGLGVLILWLGWFGFNPGSTLAAIGNRFAEVVLVTNLAAAAGVIAALAVMYRRTKTYDVGMAGNGAIAALVAITAPSGYVEFWAAPIIGAVAGVIVVYGVIMIEKVLDDPVGALSAHGLAGIWGTLSCGLFTSPRLAELNGVGDPGLWYSGSFHQLGAQALGVGTAFAIVFVVSYAMFLVMKHTIGLRVTAEEEDAGLDIAETGMYGYPEQFIPPSDLIGSGLPATSGAPHRAPAGVTATAMTGEATA